MAEQSNILGLFGLTPELYQQQQQQQLIKQQQDIASQYAQPGTMMNPSLAPLYAAATQQGQQIGQAGRSLLGIEDPQLKMVRDVTALRQQFDVSNPEGLKQFAQALSAKGYGDLAVQAVNQANAMLKTGSEAQMSATKAENERKAREEIAALGPNITDKQITDIYKKYGGMDATLKILEMKQLKEMQMNQKAMLDQQKADAAKQMGITSAQNVLSVINEARPLISDMNTGDVGGRREVWFTGAGELQTKLDTIKANLSIDKLAQMKEASKTGASGLGSLAVKELETLQSLVASLDRKQSADSLRNSLNKIEKHYQNYIAYMSGAKSKTEVNSESTNSDPLGIRK